jgi:hypothetical protein
MTTAELELATKSGATPSASATMKALVYHGPGKCAWRTSRALPSRIRAMPSHPTDTHSTSFRGPGARIISVLRKAFAFTHHRHLVQPSQTSSAAVTDM